MNHKLWLRNILIFSHFYFTYSKVESLVFDQQLNLFYQNLWFVGYTECTRFRTRFITFLTYFWYLVYRGHNLFRDLVCKFIERVLIFIVIFTWICTFFVHLNENLIFSLFEEIYNSGHCWIYMCVKITLTAL